MFDLGVLAAAVAAQGRVARVVIAAVRGSSPREVGAAMLIWVDGQSGTIGGGALEWQATATARALLAQGGGRLDHAALGPALGQCCGGTVSLLTEVYGAAEVAVLQGDVIARPLPGTPVAQTRSAGELAPMAMPMAVARALSQARSKGCLPPAGVLQGWMVEPVAPSARPLWIWGAGHVGRALVAVLAPLPGLALTWVDVAQSRFPAGIAAGVTALPAAEPPRLVAHAPRDAGHLIVTYSHALDLELCHRLLGHGFARCGLIGSATKWARFRSRLGALGHAPGQIARIDCPIGDPSFGKHPQAIAIGVAAQLLAAGRITAVGTTEQESAG